MRKTILSIFLLSLLCYTNVSAQEKVKFGNIPQEDLAMTVYAADTSAAAVVLYEACDISYDFIAAKVQVVTDYMVRIKILKAAGQEWGDVSIPFIHGTTSESREYISGISGYTYNLVDGKTERVKLTKEYIYEEETTETRRRMKIAFPNVQAGSVVELRYQHTSPYYAYIDDYFFQRSIPVRYSKYVVTIPEYYTFSKKTMGFEPIKVSEGKGNGSFTHRGERLDFLAQEMTFEASNLPALKNDGYVWDVDDFRSKVTFQLAGVQFPYSMYMTLANRWEDIDERLMDNESFGKQLRVSNLLKNEVQNIIKVDMTDEQKLTAILNLVKEKVKWNEEDRLYIKSVRGALKDGIGTSAEMNALLICLLKDVGFDAYPVVMSLRSNGRIFPSYPDLNKLNYFITGVNAGDQSYYIDASSKYGSVNVIPVECMVENARAIRKNKPSKWVDLHELGKGADVLNVSVNFNESGVLAGTVVRNARGILSIQMCSGYSKKKDQDEYIDELKARYKVEINDFEMKGCDNNVVEQFFSFENEEITLGSEYLYIKPMLFYSLNENPFKAETRKLPIEFPYPYDDITTVVFQIPEGYKVEELPKSERIMLDENGVVYMYYVKQEENILKISQRLTIAQTIYPSTNYEQIRDIWTHVIAKNNEQIVLKRIAGNS